jgi:hypothetical protein
VKRAVVGRTKRVLRPWSRLLVLGSSRAFFSSPGALYGGGVRYGSDRSRYVSWSADSLYERGVIRRERQPIELDTFTLGGNVSFARRWGFSTWRIGTALRLGRAHSATGPRGASSSTDAIVPWGWPSAQVSASFRSGPWVIDASGDLGYTVVPLAAGASGTRDTAIRGTWFGAQLGIGHAFLANPAL